MTCGKSCSFKKAATTSTTPGTTRSWTVFATSWARGTRSATLECPTKATRADLGARLPRGLPTVLYHGEQDDMVPVAHVELYARAITGGLRPPNNSEELLVARTQGVASQT